MLEDVLHAHRLVHALQVEGVTLGNDNHHAVALHIRHRAREREIMEMRFGLNGRKEKTQREVADKLGISQSYISRLEKKTIKKLKKDLEKVI